MIWKTKTLLLFIYFITLANLIFAQGELETSREPDNYNLNCYGFKLNSNGYGLYYSFSTRINHRLRRFAEVEYNYMKSSKEIKVVNPYFDKYSVKKFVFGKTYFVNNLKLGYGYNKMLFEKRDKNSISIHLLGSAGFSLGISKPIYYKIVDSVKYFNGDLYAYSSNHRIDINIQNNPTDIMSKAPFVLGLNEMKLHPGVYLKTGLSFDFSQDVMKTKTLETGLIFDYYIRPIEIMAGKENSSFLLLYMSYHFGKKYNVQLNRDYRKEMRKTDLKSN